MAESEEHEGALVRGSARRLVPSGQQASHVGGGGERGVHRRSGGSRGGGPLVERAHGQAAKTASSHLTRGVAERQVISALSATTSSGSFNVSYEFDPAHSPTVTTTTTTAASTCHVIDRPPGQRRAEWRQSAGALPRGSRFRDRRVHRGVHGRQRRRPGASRARSPPATGRSTPTPSRWSPCRTCPGLGEITLRDNGTDVWEFGGADYGLAPGSSETGPGASLSGFAGLVEGTLGARQGALAMGGLSSPTGYLDLDQSMISGADQTGTGTVDGVAVTIYTDLDRSGSG